jgi:5-methylcytosine-specific restriction protein A
MSLLDDLKPKQKFLVMDLLDQAGVDVSLWKTYNGPPAANPKYCYNWSFEQPDELVVVCIWHRSLKLRGSTVVHTSKRRKFVTSGKSPSEAVWNRRAREFDECLELAYRQQLSIRVIVVDGEQRDPKSTGRKASVVQARILDPIPWAVTEYDDVTGERVLVRGAKPTNAATASADWGLSWFEGAEKRKFVLHRQREG